MKPQRFDFDLDTPDPDGLADNNDSSGSILNLDGALTSGGDLDGIADNNSSSGTSLTLDGALVTGGVYKASDDRGHIIRIVDTATADQSGATFTITGKDETGKELIEDVTGPTSGASVYSTGRFMEISSISISNGAACGTVDVGPNGIYKSVDGLAHRLDIIDTATQDQSDSTFTVTGIDADGKAQSEAITGPGSGATVESTKYFKEVYKVAISGGDACDTVDMGTVDEAASQTVVLDHYQGYAPTIQLDVTGTINCDVQVTVQDPQEDGTAPFTLNDQEDLSWVNDSNFAAKTADTLASLAVPGMRAMRFVTNSYSAGAEAQLFVTQPRSV